MGDGFNALLVCIRLRSFMRPIVFTPRPWLLAACWQHGLGVAETQCTAPILSKLLAVVPHIFLKRWCVQPLLAQCAFTAHKLEKRF